MTTAERIQETTALIGRLEGELADAKRAEEQAREIRRVYALQAAKGDARAARALSEAGEQAARAMLAAEDTELALAAAREELAGLEAQAEQERLAAERLEALALCDQRLEAARAVDTAITALRDALGLWQASTGELQRLRRRGQSLLPADLVQPWALPLALGAADFDLLAQLGIRGVFDPDHMRPLAELDTAVIAARHERDPEADTRMPWAQGPSLSEIAGIARPPEAARDAALQRWLDAEDVTASGEAA